VRVLVLGGTGFVGSPVVAGLLRGGHEVAVLHRGTGATSTGGGPESVTEILADRGRLADASAAIRAFAPDVAIDLILSSAAQARELMGVLRGVAARVVVAGSLDVYRATGVLYGSEPGGLEPLPLTEESALRSRLHPYPASQIAALSQVFGWLDEDYDKIPVEREVLGDPELPGTVLRLPILYGPGDKLHRFRPIVQRIADGRGFIPLGEALAGWRASRSYVENVADAFVLAAVGSQAAGRIYNVAEPEALTEAEWTRLAARAAGWNGEVVVLPAARTPPHLRPPGNVAQHWVADSGRIRRELGWSERVPREEALRRTVDWERESAAPPDEGRRRHYAAEDAALAALR
jgi:nucleoside-diphosphate-sugar epimerase